ncbi:MAG: hypothetical protein RLZZ303_1571, partial [Candidatus Hydrogenedentota bacterium]|jgi:archaellum component FlaF (FlaF/FlaG flagellin family)
VSALPFQITEQPVGVQNLIPGDAYTLSIAVAGGAAIPAFQWQFNNGIDGFQNIDGATGTSLEFASLTLADSGLYRCLVTGDDGAKALAVLTSDEVEIEVEDRIRFTTQPVGGGIYVDGNFTFTVETAGTPDGPFNIQWQLNGDDIQGANSTTLEITNATLLDNGNYVCIISDDSYVIPSEPATLIVAERLSLVSDPVGGTVFEGTNVNLTVGTSGGLGELQYQWFKVPEEGEPEPVGPNSATYAFTPIALSDAGTYFVTVSDQEDTVTSGNASLAVIPPFEITTQPVGATKFVGSDSYTFNIDVVGGAPPFTFQWIKNGQNFGPPRNSANRNLTIPGPLQESDSGSYRCFVSDVNGGKFSATAVLSVRTRLAISQQPVDTAVYIGGTASLSVGLSGGIGDRTFKWKKGPITLTVNSDTLTFNNASLTLAGAYTVTVEDDFDTVTSLPAQLIVGEPLVITEQPQNAWRFIGDSVSFSVAHIKGAGEISYEWFFEDEPIEDSNSATLVIDGLTADSGGVYRCVVSDGVTSYDSEEAVLVMVEPLPNTGADVDVSLDAEQVVPPTGLLASGLVTGSIAPSGPLVNGVAEQYLFIASLVHTPIQNVTGAQIRLGEPGENGPLVENLGIPVANTLSIFEVLTSAEAAEMTAGVHYAVITSETFAEGAVRGQVILTPREPAEGEGEGIIEEGEGILEGEGEGVIEEGEGEGVVEGEGEGIVEGEGEGVVEGAIEGEGEGTVEGEGEGEGVVEGEGEEDLFTHVGDQNGDGVFDLTEVLRIIQLYNALVYSCLLESEDGYQPGAGDTSCDVHSADYEEPFFAFTLSELLRLIQLYNLGGYEACPDSGTDDGFCGKTDHL